MNPSFYQMILSTILYAIHNHIKSIYLCVVTALNPIMQSDDQNTTFYFCVILSQFKLIFLFSYLGLAYILDIYLLLSNHI